MLQGYWAFYLVIAFAALVDVVANIMLAKSEGFSQKKYGLCAIFLVAVAFSCLAYAVRGIDLTIAYVMWGSFGIFGTSLGGWLFLRQKIRLPAWVGLALLACGVFLIHT